MKTFRILLILLFSINVTYGQYYISAFSGYSVSGNNNYVSSVVEGTAYKLKSNNGQGVNLGVGGGYKFTDLFSIEVDYFTQVFNEKEFTILFYDNMDLANAEVRRSVKNNTHQLAPLFIFSKPMNKITIFLKSGINFLYCKSIIKQDVYDEGVYVANHYDSGWIIEDKGGINIGFRGAAGIQYRLTNKLSMQFEFLTVLTNYLYTDSELVSGSYLADFSQYGLNLGFTYQFMNK